MAYIFLDESGDLGFEFSKPRTSKYFVIACLFVVQKGPIEKIIKKVLQSFSARELKSHSGCLHAYKEKPKTRIKLLSLLEKKEVSIISIYLNKQKVYTKLSNEKHVLYNYVTNILLDRIYSKKLIPLKEEICLVASRRETNRFLNKNFSQYLQNQVSTNHKLKIKVEIKVPHSEKCLQIIDHVSWAIFRNKEHKDESYYNLIKSKIIEENPLFP